jgi:hypothetical protein
MDVLRPFAKRLRYNAYYKHPEVIEPILALFLTEFNTSSAMREVSEHMKVPISPIYSWGEKVRETSDWHPSPEHFFRMQGHFRLNWKRRWRISYVYISYSKDGP